MGAGFLPISVYKNKIYFLFGRENENNDYGWCDFGGSSKHNESSIETASREGAEELNGLLGDEEKIKSYITPKNSFFISINSRYDSYICKIKYDANLPMYYKNNYDFLVKKLCNQDKLNNGIFEKEEIKWFTFDDIERNKHIFRKFYKNVINKILENKEKIIEKFSVKIKK